MAKKTPAPVTDIDDLLGETAAVEDAAPAKKTRKPKAETVEEAVPAKKTTKRKPKAAEVEAAAVEAVVKKTRKQAEEAEPKAKRVREPVVFEEGERAALTTRVKRMVKKDINSRELAEKLGIATRKLRPVLYSMQKAGTVALSLGSSKVAGMTVSPV